jgi:circadian clock protein KaiC
MLGGAGVYRASSVLISGRAGTGKTSLAAHFAAAACRRGERCLYFAFEESEGQLVRNMRSIGLDLRPWLKRGLLSVHSTRPTAYGLESHLVALHKLIDEFAPRVVVVDPITTFIGAGTWSDAEAMMMRLMDFLKTQGTTAVFTSLARGGGSVEESGIGISSMIDTWIVLRHGEHDGERKRALVILKSRGMAHSSQVREFRLNRRGVELPAAGGAERPARLSHRMAAKRKLR